MSEIGKNSGQTDVEHEEKGSEDVDPEVDDNNNGENIQGLIAMLLTFLNKIFR